MSDDILTELATHDKDRYLCTLYAPPAKRQALGALYLFQAELQRIERQVSEPQIGSIRLQWWREALTTMGHGHTPEHPLAVKLMQVVHDFGLPTEGLQSLIDAQEQSLHQETPVTLEDLERHLGQSSSMLMQLAVLVLGGSAPETAGLAGVSYGLARLLQGSGRWFVPTAMREELGDEVAINTLAGHAKRRLLEARRTAFAPELLPAFLVAATVPVYLAAVNRNLSSPGPVSQFRRQGAIWWAARNNRF